MPTKEESPSEEGLSVCVLSGVSAPEQACTLPELQEQYGLQRRSVTWKPSFAFH